MIAIEGVFASFDFPRCPLAFPHQQRWVPLFVYTPPGNITPSLPKTGMSFFANSEGFPYFSTWQTEPPPWFRLDWRHHPGSPLPLHHNPRTKEPLRGCKPHTLHWLELRRQRAVMSRLDSSTLLFKIDPSLHCHLRKLLSNEASRDVSGAIEVELFMGLNNLYQILIRDGSYLAISRPWAYSWHLIFLSPSRLHVVVPMNTSETWLAPEQVRETCPIKTFARNWSRHGS